MNRNMIENWEPLFHFSYNVVLKEGYFQYYTKFNFNKRNFLA